MFYVMFSRPFQLDDDQFIAAFNERHGAGRARMLPPTDETEVKAWFLEVDGRLVTIMAVDMPLPKEQFRTEIYLARRWPMATPVFLRHSSHVIIASLGKQEGFEATRLSAEDETLVAAVLAETCGASAFIYAPSKVYSPIAPLIAAATALSAKGTYPDQIWVGLNLVNADRGQVMLMSLGLYPFVGYEIETPMNSEQTDQVTSRYPGLVSYLLANGTVLREGDRVGVTETEKLHVRFTRKGEVFKGPVMDLTSSAR